MTGRLPIGSARALLRLHWPVLMLLLATVFWGMGFSWSKNNVDAINRSAGLASDAALGPLLGLALRFGTASVLWAACARDVRRDWSRQTVRRGLAVGLALSLGLMLQHLSLGQSDEATAAFLTNLTVVFVPAWQLAVMRQPVRRPVLIAVPIALLGMVLLGGVGRPGPVLGLVYGIACAVAFAAEILLLDRLGRGESATRMTLMILLTAAVSCGALSATLPGFADVQWRTLCSTAFLADFVPGVLLTTLAAFALMTAYQPRVSATRAAVLYLGEPLVAAGYAWWYNGRTMTPVAIVGAALILLANGVAELKRSRV